MRNVLLICVGLVALGFWFDKPTVIPISYLDVYENGKLNQRGVMLGGSCSTKKCLTVYVAPWCSACKSLTPTIDELASELRSEGINANIVIGHDTLASVKAYSKRYTGPIYEDESGQFYTSIGISGVPYFAVTDSSGVVIKDMSGGHSNVARMREVLDL